MASILTHHYNYAVWFLSGTCVPATERIVVFCAARSILIALLKRSVKRCCNFFVNTLYTRAHRPPEQQSNILRNKGCESNMAYSIFTVERYFHQMVFSVVSDIR